VEEGGEEGYDEKDGESVKGSGEERREEKKMEIRSVNIF